MNLRNAVYLSTSLHVAVIAGLYALKGGDAIVLPGPDVVQVALVDPGALPPSPAPAPAPVRRAAEEVVPPEPEEGVKIETPRKKQEPRRVEPPRPEPARPEPPAPVAPAANPSPTLPSAPIGPAGLSGDVAVDAADFAFTYYLMLVRGKIAQNWSAVGDASEDRRRAVVYFRIGRDGSISGVRLESSSGMEFFDRSALRAVTISDPLPPLPIGYSGSQLGVHFGFDLKRP